MRYLSDHLVFSLAKTLLSLSETLTRWLVGLTGRRGPAVASRLRDGARKLADEVEALAKSDSVTFDLTVKGRPMRLYIPGDNGPARHFRDSYETSGGYEIVMVDLLTRLLDRMNDPVFVDVGAFIGFYTCYVGKLLDGKGSVYAVESNPDHVLAVERSVELNGLGNVKIIAAALSDTEETVRAVGRTVVRGGSEGVELKAVTFDQVCVSESIAPDIMKMDIHGAEGKAIGGMTATLRDHVSFLLLELHPNQYLRKYSPGVDRHRILDVLEECGFRNYYIAGHRYSWSDGYQHFLDSGRFSYHLLTDENRGMLLFDRYNHLLILASKHDLEPIVGPSVLDPSLRQ